MRLFLLLGISVVFLSGCMKDNEDKDEVGCDVQLTLYEDLQSDPNKLILVSQTEEVFECANYSLESTFQLTSEGVRADYTGITVPSVCVTQNGPAVSQGYFPLDEGNYELELYVDEELNTGSLSVTDSLYVLKMDVQPSIDVLTDSLWRIEEGLYWGSVVYFDTEHEELVDNFVDSLNLLDVTYPELHHGYYGYFNYNEEGLEVTAPDNGYIRGIVFKSNGDSDVDVKNTILSYAVNYPQQLTIKFVNYKGDIISIYSK